MNLADSLRRLGHAVLGRDPRQRLRASQSLLALAVYGVCAAVQHLEVLLGLIAPEASLALTAFNLSGALLFYTAIRSGLNQRWESDPSLTLPQCGFALVGIVWSYAITGPARGAIMSIMILVILFGVFSLRPRQAAMLALASFVGLAAVMGWRSLNDPLRYDPRVELMHFIFAAVVMSATAALMVRLGRLRAHLTAQKDELGRALALNRELAASDMLTGLLNRRAMVALLDQPDQRRSPADAATALAMLDIDWFKRINDKHGHQVGDAVLQRFAELARSQLRAGDSLARWGGEEFLLLMPGTSRADAARVVERLRVMVASGGFESLAEGLTLSFSAGVAAIDDAEHYASAIERADQALYRAKHAGRNRLELAA